MIYLDNAATTLKKPRCVIDAVTTAMLSHGNADRGAHSDALSASRSVYTARVRLAKLFGLKDPSRVIMTCNATEALNIAIFGTIKEGDHVITTDLEHNSVLRPLYALEEEKGVKLDFVKADAKGCVNYLDFEGLIRPETRAIICTHASNLTGNVLDLKRIGQIAKAHDLLFIVDASQTAGIIPINIEETHIDILCFTGHKGLMGPQGTGGMCIREGVEIAPFKRGGSGIQTYDRHHPDKYPTRLEAGTLNSHGIAGLSAALAYIEETGIEKIHQKETQLMEYFYRNVSKIEGVEVYGEFGEGEDEKAGSGEDRKEFGLAEEAENGEDRFFFRCPIVSLNIRDYDSGTVADALAQSHDIAVRAGGHCAPRMHQALHTDGKGAVRFSFAYFNTMEEVEKAVEAVREIAQAEEGIGE